MDTGVRPRIGAAGNLWFGLVNPGEHEVDCHLVVEVPAEHRECFPRSHGRWTKWVRVAPRKSAVVPLSFLAQAAGEFPLSIRLFVEPEQNDGAVSFLQVPMEERPRFSVSDDPGGGSITVTNNMTVGTNYAGDLTQKSVMDSEALREVQEQMAGGVHQGACEPVPLPLAEPDEVCGCCPASRSVFGGEAWRVDMVNAGSIDRRVYLFAKDQLWFGRNDRLHSGSGKTQGNDLAWRWLPCRSEEADPDFFQRNRTISRFRIGSVNATSEKTSLRCGQNGLTLDGQAFPKGAEIELASGVSRKIELGTPPLRVSATALKSRRRGPEFDLLQEAASLGGRSGRIDTSFRHDAVLLERLNNLKAVCYLLFLRHVSVGGHSNDAVTIPGWPRGAVQFARFGGSVFVLAPDRGSGSGQPNKKWWRPVHDGMEVQVAEGKTARIASADVEQTKLESDLTEMEE